MINKNTSLEFTKEEWLTKAGELILSEYAKRGYDLLKNDNVTIYFRSIPPIAAKGTLGWCIHQAKTFYIYVKDVTQEDYFRDVYDVLHTLVHEVCHALDREINNTMNHGKSWKKLMRLVDASDKARTEPNKEHSIEFKAFADNLLENLPEYKFKDYYLVKKEKKPKKQADIYKKKFATQMQLFEFVQENNLQEHVEGDFTLSFRYKKDEDKSRSMLAQLDGEIELGA